MRVFTVTAMLVLVQFVGPEAVRVIAGGGLGGGALGKSFQMV